MPIDEESREQGVEFGPLADKLENTAYPIEKSELLEVYGEYELQIQDANPTLNELLGPIGDTTYNSVHEVVQGVVGMVGDEAIGRKKYTDRGGILSEDENRGDSF